MITYLDTSTLIKLIIEEPGSSQAERIWDSADSLASVSLVVVEARAALAAAHRGGRLSAAQLTEAKASLAALVGDLYLLDVSDELLDSAAQLCETAALRGYDAVHLAAALFVGSHVFSSADRALCDAAEAHGMYVADPIAG